MNLPTTIIGFSGRLDFRSLALTLGVLFLGLIALTPLVTMAEDVCTETVGIQPYPSLDKDGSFSAKTRLRLFDPEKYESIYGLSNAIESLAPSRVRDEFNCPYVSSTFERPIELVLGAVESIVGVAISVIVWFAVIGVLLWIGKFIYLKTRKLKR